MLWSGEPAEVLDGLLGLQQKVGLPNPDEPESSPRNHLAAAIRYLKNQQSRMRYAEYRQAGLPITSCHMESTIKQINRRVKGTEKVWNGGQQLSVIRRPIDRQGSGCPDTSEPGPGNPPSRGRYRSSVARPIRNISDPTP